MRVKILIFLVLFSASFFLAGCVNTIKGAAKGAANGMLEDWQAIKKADKWFREHYW